MKEFIEIIVRNFVETNNQSQVIYSTFYYLLLNVYYVLENIIFSTI